MKNKKEIEDKLEEMEFRLQNQSKIVYKEILGYYKGFVNALKWILDKEN